MEYAIIFDDGSGAYLSHHGVAGMKWGVHNEETKQKYGEIHSAKEAKGAVKELNKLDKKRAVEAGKNIDARKAVTRYTAKAIKADNKGNERKFDKYMSKAEKYGEKLEESKKNIDAIDKQTSSIVKSIDRGGYSVSMKSVRRSTLTTGQKVAQGLMATATMSLGGVAATHNRYVDGTKYKFSKKNSSSDNRTSKKSPNYSQYETATAVAKKK